MQLLKLQYQEVIAIRSFAQYDHHTYEPQSCSTQSNAPGQASIDGAIAFVKSLRLEDQGYGYIAEQCLDELELFRDNHFELEAYYENTDRIVQIANSYFNRGEVCVEALKDPYASWK